MRSKGKKWFILLVAITMFFVYIADFGVKENIVVCSSLEQFRSDELQLQLNKEFPQYNVTVMYMPTGKAASKIYAEGTDSEVDILVGMETGYLGKIKDSLENIEGISRIDYLDGLKPEDNGNLWVTWERQAGAIVINPNVLEKHGLKAPKSYEDLLKPEYKGLIAMPDPKSSGTGYFFYKSWVNEMGDEKALEYVDRLYENLKQLTESGSGPIKMLKQGEVAVGLGLTFQSVNEINAGQPLEIIFAEEGSPYSLTGTAMIKGHKEKEGVTEVFDYIANEFFVYDKNEFSPEAVYEGQENKVENYPQNIKYANMDGIQEMKEKERLLDLWKY